MPNTYIITVKKVNPVTKGNKTYYELTDQEGKVHRVFESVKNAEGEWVSLKEKMPIAHNALNRTLKLTKEKVGDYWQVIDLEYATLPEPKTESKPEPKQDVKSDNGNDPRAKSMCLAYAKDLCVGNKISVNDVLVYATIFTKWLNGDINVEEVAVTNALVKKNKEPVK